MPKIFHYKIITKVSELDELINYCKITGYASIDFETTGHPVHSPLGKPTILGCSFQPGSAWILPLAHFDSPFKSGRRWKRMLKKFGREVIANKDIVKIAWNLQFEYQWFKKYQIEMTGRLFDGMLAKYLLLEERPNDLKSVTSTFMPERADYEVYEGSKLPWDQKPLEGLSKYCAIDCDSTFQLMLTFEPLLIKHDFYKLFRNMLMMGSRVLGDSSYHGMPVDVEYLEGLMVTYKEKIKISQAALEGNSKILRFNKWLLESRIEKAIKKIDEEIEELQQNILEAGKDEKIIARKEKSINNREEKISRLMAKDFTNNKEKEMAEPINFASPNQLIDLLFLSPKGFNFKIVKYTTDKKTKKETTRPSTDEEVLLTLEPKDKSGFISQILVHRGLTKLYSTYVEGMYNKLSHNHTVHGSYLLHGTVTGRLSSRDPNFQNIPRDTTASDIKTMFIPPKGMVLLQLDYSQAELRVMAAQAGETNMIHWFKIGRDIHLAVACDVNNWEYDWAKEILDKEDKEDPDFYPVKTQRKKAKTINFGIIYGQTAKKLAIGLESTLAEAEEYLRMYKERFPRIAKFIKKQNRFVLKNGYVRNIFGRKRRLPNIYSTDWGKKAEAERQSVNAPIQGAASDYTLFSSILIWEKIRAGILPGTIIQAYTVHDSLGYFIYPKDIHKVVPIMNDICANPETMEWFGFQIDDVTMQVDFEISATNWGQLKTYNSKYNYEAAA